MPNAERLIDGEDGFIGVDTRMNPSVMKEGVLSEAINVRMDSMALFSRRGIKSVLGSGESSLINEILGSCHYVDRTGEEKIALITADAMFLFNPTTQTLSPEYAYPTELLNGVSTRKTVSGRVNAFQAVNNIYILRGEVNRIIDATLTAGSSPHTTITVTTTDPHGLIVGDEFSIESLSHTNQSGSFFVQSVPTSTTFTYKLPAGHNGNGDCVVYVGKAPLVWNGLSSLSIVRQKDMDGISSDFPICSVAIYHRNRIICKVSRDEIAVSDYLTDNNGDWKFDRTIQQYSINDGDGQDIVGFHPWTQDKVLVFKNRSIYELKIADNTSNPDVNLQDSYVKTLNSEIGCVARKTIANVGTKVFFLSQNGVYTIEPQLDTQLLTNTVPISRPMQKYIDLINSDYEEFACGKVYNGRYYLAVPIAYEQEVNGVFTGVMIYPEYNNRTLVYSLINNMWESIDVYPEGFDVESMTVMKYGKSSRLLFTDFDGSVFVAEEGITDEYGLADDIGPDLSKWNDFLTEDQQPIRVQGIPLAFSLEEQDAIFQRTPVNSVVRSRAYSFDKFDQKRFSRVAVVGGTNDYCGLLISYITRNPDDSQPIDYVDDNNNDFQSKTPIRKIGQDLMVEVKCQEGQFYLTGIKVDAVMVGRNIKDNN
jgi:hypothetical protein